MPNEADETTKRILDAALLCFATKGVQKTTMNFVAEKAGVGVATVYRRFPQKLQLLQTVLIRELTELVDTIDAAIADAASFEDQLLTGFVTFARELSSRSLLRDMSETDLVAEFLAVLPSQVPPILALGRNYLANLIRRWQESGQLPADLNADMVAEIYARLAHSIAMSPEGAIPLDDPEAAKAFARRYLLPVLRPNGD